jgi:hypothetical protein
MAKKFKKTVQRVETAKINEVFSTNKSSSLEDLKIKLAGVDKSDPLFDLKNKLILDDSDPLAELKKSLKNNLEDGFSEKKDEIVSEILEDIHGISEESIIEKIVVIEQIEDIYNEQNLDISNDVSLDSEKNYFLPFFTDIIDNNILIRTINKENGDKIVVHIALNNSDFDTYKEVTSKPFDIYNKGNKIIDFYTCNELKKDIYILKNNLVIDTKTYLLSNIKILNI